MGGQLDAFHNLSNDLVKAAIVMRFDHYGWCRGVIEYRNQDRRRKFQGRLVNFVAQFDIDEGITDLTLEAEDYDTSPDAPVGAWCLLEPVEAEDVETAEEAEARVTGLDGRWMSRE